MRPMSDSVRYQRSPILIIFEDEEGTQSAKNFFLAATEFNSFMKSWGVQLRRITQELDNVSIYRAQTIPARTV